LDCLSEARPFDALEGKVEDSRGNMIDLPINAKVHCLNGVAGRSTYIIGNPIKRQITYLVVKSYWPPFPEILVPVNKVGETMDNRIQLKCTVDDFSKMEPFEYEEYIHTETSGYLFASHVVPGVAYVSDDVDNYVPMKRKNISQDEIALRRGARVEATNGYVGQVDELLIDSTNMQVTHLVLLERHIFQKREITIPVSQIDHVFEDTVYLKLDRQSMEALPTTPRHRWDYEVTPKGRA
jgi:sporulation protein YlmC with PRC-barrel domain